MRVNLKKVLLIIVCLLSLSACSGQKANKDFDLFLANFTEFTFPLNPIAFLVDREANLISKNISETDYRKFLADKNDSFWLFKKDYEYRYGGKKKAEDYWLLFYSRNYLPDDVHLQKSEVILSVFSADGRMISAIPVAGSYGDSLTFSSIIDDAHHIVLRYTSYKKDTEQTWTKQYFMDAEGILRLQEGD